MIRRKKRTSIQVPQSSIVLNLEPILAARNIKTSYSYLTNLGINGKTAQKMLNGTSVQLNYDQLTKLCINLNCTPNELFATRDLQLPTDHALQLLKVFSNDNVISITNWLAGKTLKEIEQIIKENK